MMDTGGYPPRFQSVCRWTFNPGRGGYVPADTRPGFAGMTATGFVGLVRDLIAPRVPPNTVLGIAIHYGAELSENDAGRFAEAAGASGLALSMLSPSAHQHFAYGGLASADPAERDSAREFARRALALLAGPLSTAVSARCPAVLDIWNGSLGYDIPTASLIDRLRQVDEAVTELVIAASSSGPVLKVGIEPKPSEGHPALLLQTSSDVLALRGRLRAAGVDVSRFGLINEFGHSEMAGLDPVQDCAAALLEDAVVHIHANSQGWDGIRLGGPGKYDVDFGLAPSATVFAIAGMLSASSYAGWIEHDMQPRPYDGEARCVDRVVKAICNWEAVMRLIDSGVPDLAAMNELAVSRRTLEIEDMLRDAVARAHAMSRELYGGSEAVGRG